MAKERMHCNSCNRETWHLVIAHAESNFYDDLFCESKRMEGQILTCQGCEDMVFVRKSYPFRFEKNGGIDVDLYPKRSHEFRSKKFYMNVPGKIRTIYGETISAYDNKLFVLATVGVRGLIEAVVKDNIDSSKYKNNIVSKIDALVPYFDTKVIEALHSIRELGNTAVHEADGLEPIKLNRAINVVESIMGYFYDIKDAAENFSR